MAMYNVSISLFHVMSGQTFTGFLTPEPMPTEETPYSSICALTDRIQEAFKKGNLELTIFTRDDVRQVLNHQHDVVKINQVEKSFSPKILEGCVLDTQIIEVREWPADID